MPSKTSAQVKPTPAKAAPAKAVQARKAAPAKAAPVAKRAKVEAIPRKPAPLPAPTAKAAKGAGRPGKASAAKVSAPKPKAPVVTLKQLSAGVAARHSLDAKQSAAIVAGVFEAVVGHVLGGDKVKIAGLGVIELKDRPARAGRNPATGETIQVKASRKIGFRASKELRASI